MFYAKFREIENSDIAEFQTEQERDEWVNFQDEFSRDFGTTLDNCVFNLTTKFINTWINIYSSSDTNPSTIKKILLKNVEFIGYPSGITGNRYLIYANKKCIFSGEVFIIDSCITDSPYMNIVNFLNISGGICKVQNTKVTSINNNSTIVENPIQVLYKNSYTINDIYNRKYPLLASSVVNL